MILPPENRETPVAEIAPPRHQTDFRILDLPRSAFVTQLPRRFDYVIHPPHMRLRMKSAVRVDWKIAAQFKAAALDEIFHFASLAEPQRLHLDQHDVTEAVVNFSKIEI